MIQLLFLARLLIGNWIPGNENLNQLAKNRNTKSYRDGCAMPKFGESKTKNVREFFFLKTFQ